MNSELFLQALRQQLAALPEAERERCIEDYQGMILDRMEDGASEQEVLAELGRPEEIARQILADMPITTLVRERIRPKRRLSILEIILLILGAPLWLPLLIVGIVVAFSLLVAFFSVVLALFAVVCAIVYYGATFFLYAQGNSLMIAGISIGCIGLGLLLLLAAISLAFKIGKGLTRLIRRKLIKRDTNATL